MKLKLAISVGLLLAIILNPGVAEANLDTGVYLLKTNALKDRLHRIFGKKDPTGAYMADDDFNDKYPYMKIIIKSAGKDQEIGDAGLFPDIDSSSHTESKRVEFVIKFPDKLDKVDPSKTTYLEEPMYIENAFDDKYVGGKRVDDLIVTATPLGGSLLSLPANTQQNEWNAKLVTVGLTALGSAGSYGVSWYRTGVNGYRFEQLPEIHFKNPTPAIAPALVIQNKIDRTPLNQIKSIQ